MRMIPLEHGLFTLAHEIAHLRIGKSGLSGGTAFPEIEKFCNDVASEIPLPSGLTERLEIAETTSFEIAIDQIANFAEKHNVSNTMIAYMLYRIGAISIKRFERFKIHIGRHF